MEKITGTTLTPIPVKDIPTLGRPKSAYTLELEFTRAHPDMALPVEYATTKDALARVQGLVRRSSHGKVPNPWRLLGLHGAQRGRIVFYWYKAPEETQNEG